MNKQYRLISILILCLLFGILFNRFGHRNDNPAVENNHDYNGEPTNAMEGVTPEYEEAFNVIKENFLFFNPKSPTNIADSSSLLNYLHQFDKSSEYLIKSEYEAFKHAQNKMYVGIGMEIEKNDAGDVICFPFPGSPAYNSGIELGDVLKSVNGKNISNLTIFGVAYKLLGKLGSIVSVGVKKTKTDKSMTFAIKRQWVNYDSIALLNAGGVPIIKIHSFQISTKRELKFALIRLEDQPVIIIDLRDNPGGDFYQAVDSAMLFLPSDTLIVSVKKRGETKEYKSTTPAFNKKSKILIWQNEKTASAAEIFTAALTANNRAKSIGKQSYGKGTTQDIFELSDGSALFLTIGYLLTPTQLKYHKIGLNPTYEIKEAESSMEVYLDRTKEVINQKYSDS
nr:S41 family peptidase [uncultured Desulfobacter sp.]